MNDRYTGKPLLRLLELYVLDTIGQLDDRDEDTLATMTPKLEEIYEIQGNWKEITQRVMELPDNMPSLIVEMWNKYQQIAEENNQNLEGEQFAIMFVDQNFI